MDMTKERPTIKTEINGHKVIFCFQEEYNSSVAATVRTTLIDSFIRKQKIPATANSL